MSGHSKWSQIKHKKGASDQKRGQLFGKLIRVITMAARDNPDPASNFRLKTLIDKARSLNVPNDTLDRALKRTSDTASENLEELLVGVVAHGGASLLVTAITNNSNRTIGEIRTLAGQHDIRVVPEVSLLWQFKKIVNASGEIEYVPQTTIPVDSATIEEIEKFKEALKENDDVQAVFSNISPVS